MVTLSETLKMIDERSSKAEGIEELDLEDSTGRILAKDIHSEYDFPPFNRSAMDGFAFRHSDTDGIETPSFRVKEEIFAGDPSDAELEKGECFRIMTGGVVPPSCDTVAEFEICDEENGKIRLRHVPNKFSNIALKGEDLQKGAVAIEKGRIVTPKVINLLGSLGLTKVPVVRKAKIAVLSTGDELVDISAKPKFGQVRDSSRHSLRAQISEIGQEFVDLGTVGDDETVIRERISKGLESDILLITGGSSVGDKDLTLKLLESTGAEILVKKMSIKPGRPTIIAKAEKDGRDVWIFGMPGNPVSAFVVFKLITLHLLERMFETSELHPRILKGTMGFDFSKDTRRMHFVPCVAKVENGSVTLTELKYNGSGDFTTLSKANAFFVAPKEVSTLKTGDTVEFFFF